ncbi:MAG: hypothetical protein ACKPCF_19145 [Dolichospermum sp.]
MIFDSLRGVAIQELVGINSVFPVPCSLLRVPCSLFPDHTSKFTESNRIRI